MHRWNFINTDIPIRMPLLLLLNEKHLPKECKCMHFTEHMYYKIILHFISFQFFSSLNHPAVIIIFIFMKWIYAKYKSHSAIWANAMQIHRRRSKNRRNKNLSHTHTKIETNILLVCETWSMCSLFTFQIEWIVWLHFCAFFRNLIGNKKHSVLKAYCNKHSLKVQSQLWMTILFYFFASFLFLWMNFICCHRTTDSQKLYSHLWHHLDLIQSEIQLSQITRITQLTHLTLIPKMRDTIKDKQISFYVRTVRATRKIRCASIVSSLVSEW